MSLVTRDTIPMCFGITFQDDNCVRPVIFLNSAYKRWGKTLVHEMVHVAEPELRHGKLFNALVDSYWRNAKRYLDGLGGL